jgi:class 3 adenylate cyclase/DNA-binding NarL/FixJ family response regulator
VSNDNATTGRPAEAAHARRAFLAYMRHELRTPLNAIIGYSEMLIEDAESLHQSDIIPDLQKIHASGVELLALVNDLLEPAKIEAGLLDREDTGVHLRLELRIPLNTIIGYSEMLLETVTAQLQAELIPDLQNIRVAGDRLVALIEDAVNLSSVKSGGLVPDAAAAISTLAADVEAPNPRDREGDAAASLAEQGLLLVVDDEETNRDILSRRLRRQGHMVVVACDGAEALAILENHPFDVVLLDILMPGMNGYEVLQRMKAHETWRDIPVIMISALHEIDGIVKCIQMGAVDYLPKPFNPVLLAARVGASLERKRLHDLEAEHLRQIQKLVHELELRNKFIRDTFGRYLTDELVASLLETADGLKFGGESRRVTIMMSDLRGFTLLSERLAPPEVVTLLNIYLGVMADVITEYQGTIDEIIGDAILIIFGAPILRANDAERAVACAMAMQRAMATVNELNRSKGLPELAMGIGINTGEVVVGNIGSLKRTKYGVTGSQVNLTSRIESYTVGGQVLISEATLKEVGDILRIEGQMTVEPKGVRTPITVYEVGGIAGSYNLYLSEKVDALVELPREVRVRYRVVEDKHQGSNFHEGFFVRLAANRAEIRSTEHVPPLSNVRLKLIGKHGEELPGDLYGKSGAATSDPDVVCLNFTCVTPELAAVLQQLRSGEPEY